MEKDYLEEERYFEAQKRVKEIKGFYWNLFWYLFTNIVWLGIIFYFNAEDRFFDFEFFGMGYGLVANILFWGIGLLIHWFIVFGRHLTFSKGWEEQKIKQFMEKDNNIKH